MQGKTINGFELKKLLGVGGMAEVWYAESKIETKAAVKILNEKLSHDDQMQERFLNEAKVLVELDHPNIRKVYSFDEIDGRPAIVMEYLEGSDLKARMKSGQHFTDEELHRWWNQMVDVLNYTHAQNIVHRDIKPSNIFIDQKGNAKLLDFGIAKVTDTTTGTLTGSTLGTRIYMSPEQVRDPKRVGPPSDVYSLAVSFVHLLTGKAPYDSTTSSDYDIQESIVRKPVDMSKVPAEWRGFLAPYLIKEADQRPALRHFEIASKEGRGAKQKDDDETVTDEPKPQPKAQPSTKDRHSGFDPLSPVLNDKSIDNPKSKKGLWIGLGITTAAVVALLVLFLKHKQEPTPTDPDTQAYEACQTVTDYRAYLSDFGRNALHYDDAKAFIDEYMADSIKQAQEAQALAEAVQKDETERQAQAEAERAENEAYGKCTTIAACESYLKAYPQGCYVDKVKKTKADLEEDSLFKGCTYIEACNADPMAYPNGKYVEQVKKKKAELELIEAEKKEDDAYKKCTTIAACDSYLKTYPKGRYVTEVRKMKADLEKKAEKPAQTTTNTDSDHAYVDLGLPSGTLWATCNVGASKPEDYGYYYAWGETKTKSTYNWGTYKYTNGDGFKMTKYCNVSRYGNIGFVDNLTTLQASDDPATTKWGSGWRTPSKAQWDELLVNTTYQWTMKNGVKGRLFTSKKNGQTLFLPAAGYRRDSELNGASSSGYYWSRSLDTDSPCYALKLYFDFDDCCMNCGYYYRRYGFSVRPVREK